ncbi:MAG: FAD-binding oxidoreductase [Thermoplasmata archaeon]
MSKDEQVSKLKEILGEERVLHNRVDVLPYCSDYSHRDSYVEYGVWPACVVLPETTEEVSEIVKLAASERIPIVPRGGGSSQVGGSMPVHGSIVVSTARMNKVIDIDSVNMMVTAQPGVNLKEIDDVLEPHGLILAQEQGSYKTANIGGAVSTNGFSMRHNRYRDIGENVLSLEVVLGDGSVLRTGRKVCSNSSGYPLHKLFVGAEGTLGIITELTLRIHRRPEKELAVLALLDGWEKAQKVAWELNSSGLNFAGGYGFELDREELGGRVAGVLVGIEGTTEEVDATAKRVRRLIEEHGGRFLDDETAWNQWRLGRMLWCGTAAETDLCGDDLVVAMPLQYYDEARERIIREVYPKYGATVGGENARVVLLGTRHLVTFGFYYDPKALSLSRLKEMFGEMMRIVAEYGGVGPGCHATGMLLADHFEIEHDPVRAETMRRIKRALDPYNIMNPGKKLLM